jgi:hypothetical protein
VNKLKNTFLYQIYINHKILFCFVVTFIIGQIFFIYKGVETFPFLNYGMYSEYCPKSDTLQVLKFHKDISKNNIVIDESDFCLFGKPIHSYLEVISTGDPVAKVLKKRFNADTTSRIYKYFHQHLINTKSSSKFFQTFIYKTYQRKFKGNLVYVTLNNYLLSSDYSVELLNSDTIFRY